MSAHGDRPDPALLVEVTRRDEVSGRELVESRHHGHLVVAVDDEVVLAIGDPEHPTFPRSSAKPVQATVCLEVLAEHGWPGGRPTAREVAIGWASHRAEDVHLAAAADLCDRAGIPADGLTCPPALRPGRPADGERRLHHNCSGKHALFALAGAALGLRGEEVLDRTGPLQHRILAALDDVVGPTDAVGIDGCGAPAVRGPLAALARGFGRLADEERWAAVRDAAFAHPVLVAGTGWLDSALLAHGTFAKRGADGVRAVGWVAGGRRVGVALKVEDGADRAADTALAALAEAAGRWTGHWTPAPVEGGGRTVGHVRPAAPLLDGLRDVAGLG